MAVSPLHHCGTVAHIRFISGQGFDLSFQQQYELLELLNIWEAFMYMFIIPTLLDKQYGTKGHA